MDHTRVKVPLFSDEDFRTYMDEVEMWREVAGVAKEKQGMLLWLELPRHHPSDIKDLIMNKIGKEELKKETGADKFVTAMEEAFGQADEVRDFEVYKGFYKNMQRKPEEKISDFINRFDTAANLAKKHKMALPEKVKGLKLLDDAGLTDNDTKLVLSDMDFKNEEETYKQAKAGLAKYMNKYVAKVEDSGGIKLDSVLTVKEEEVLLTKGWTRPQPGRGRGGGGSGFREKGGAGKEKHVKNINQAGEDGKPLICPSCGSYRHLLAECPDSYENQAKKKSQAFAAAVVQESGEEEDALFMADYKYGMKKMATDGPAEDVIMYTNNKEKIAHLGGECLGSALLDCGCTSNVMGEAWWRSYKASLSPELKAKVKESDPAGKKFRFGGGRVLPSIKLVMFPATLAGKDVMFRSHVVSSDIPLLWSRPSMAKAGTVLDLPQDKAKIFGEWIDLNRTSVGHYSIDILPKDDKTVEQSLLALPEDGKEKEKVLVKLHRQFGHPREEVMLGLLKKVKCDDKETKEVVTKIHERCKTCKQFSPTPPRPVVSLPAASEFGEVLTMDLKEVKVHRFRYILHMIDAFTRFTVSVFINDKKAETIVHHVMLHWVSAGYGRPGKIWTDVGGEFNNDMVRQMGEAIGTKVDTGAGYAAWMNGLNERNHCVVDRCFAKIINDYPRMDPTIALAWAVTAKNSFPMTGGFSSFQLVFGKQPKLPNIMTDRLPALEGVTTSESVAAHINALYAGRKAFAEVQCEEKVRRALRHKVRAVERRYEAGEKVYYRRDGDKAVWRGPATVLGSKGSVHFLVHQGDVVRVAACRLVTTGEAEEQIGAKPEQLTEPGSRTRVAEDPHHTLRSPSVAGLCARCDRSDNNHGDAANREMQDAEERAVETLVPGEGEAEVAPVQAAQEPGEVEIAPAGPQAPGVAAIPELQEEGPAAAGQEAPAEEHHPEEPAAGRRMVYPKQGDRIRFKVGEEWKLGEVLGRGGKATSKLNSDYFNVRSEDKQEGGIHLKKTEWRFEDDGDGQEEEAMVALIPTKEHGTMECVMAKMRELEAFKEFEVYEEVKDEGQERLSSRWIMTDKSTAEEKKVKARLVCRGFEESVKVQADSPTGSKETLHMLLSIAATKDWKVKSGDVKNAYLQGELLDRDVFMEPPQEQKKPGNIWKLRKAVYGMNDAGRKWYFKVEKTLSKLGCKKSQLDHCLFTSRLNNTLAGIILVWVDDIFFAGTDEFEEKVMGEVGKEFMIGRTEEETFLYIGLAITTTDQGITLDQTGYVKDRLEPAVLRGGDAKRPLDKEEMKLLRRLTGKINWAATQSRPDLSYTVVELSTKFKQPQLEDLKKANKAIIRLTANPVKLLFPKITGGLKIVIYSDAAFRNLPDQISSGRGHIVFLTGGGGRAAPLGWTSNKVKRVVGSTVAAEALSLKMGLDHGFYLRAILAEVLAVDMFKIPIIAHIDSNNLFEAVYSTKFVEDKKLRLDIAQIQEAIAKEKVELRWIRAGDMLADCLTKSGAKADQLLTVLTTGSLGRWEERVE
jgi:hypothetical protein